jgi:hypothetical protein
MASSQSARQHLTVFGYWLFGPGFPMVIAGALMLPIPKTMSASCDLPAYRSRPGLARPVLNSVHRPLHRTGADTLQGFLANSPQSHSLEGRVECL